MGNRQFPNRKIPFFGNHDGMSCGQCVYKMMLAYFYPDSELSFEEMNDFCGAIPNKATWPYRALVNLVAENLDIITWYGPFDVSSFISDPYEYMKEQYSEELYDYAIQSSDIEKAVLDATDYQSAADLGLITCKYSASLNDVRSYLEDGYLINLWVDPGVLNNSEFAGHFILVHDFDENGFYVHDAGGYHKKTKKLNDFPNRYIKNSVLQEAAQTDDHGKISDMVAVKKK